MTPDKDREALPVLTVEESERCGALYTYNGYASVELAMREGIAIGLARAASHQSEAVGEVCELLGSNGGFTLAVFKASDVPVGTKLYAHPPRPSRAADADEPVAAFQMLKAALQADPYYAWSWHLFGIDIRKHENWEHDAPERAADAAQAVDSETFEEWYLRHTGKQPTLANARYYALTKEATTAKAAWLASREATPPLQTALERDAWTADEVAMLVRYVGSMTDDLFSWGDIDCFDQQGAAEACGLIKPFTVTEGMDVEDCQPGDTAYQFTTFGLKLNRAYGAQKVAAAAPSTAGDSQ